MLVILPQEFTEYTDGQAQVEVRAATPRTALLRLFNAFPRLYLHVLGPEGCAAKYACVLDDEYFLDSENCASVFDTLEFVEVPSGADPVSLGFGVIMAFDAAVGGVAMGATALLTSSITAGIIGTIAMVGISMGISALSGMIMGKPGNGLGNVGSVGGSYSNSFSGVQNSTAPGTSIPVVYGTHRFGGQVLSVSTSSTQSKSQGYDIQYYDILKAVLAVSEGPIQKIEELKVNGYPSTYYDGWLNDNNNFPMSYTLGGGDVASVLTHNTYTLDGNVFGNLTDFTSLENTNSVINNAIIQSIQDSVTYEVPTAEDWIVVKDEPVLGYWVYYGWYHPADGEYYRTAQYEIERVEFVPGGTSAVSKLDFGTTPPLAKLYHCLLMVGDYEDIVNQTLTDVTDIVVSWKTDADTGTVLSQMLSTPYSADVYIGEMERVRVINISNTIHKVTEQVPLNSVITYKDGKNINTILSGNLITKVSTVQPVIGVRVQIEFPHGLYALDISQGTYNTLGVDIFVFHKREGLSSWTALPVINISGNQTSAILKDIVISDLVEGVYEIAVVRLQEEVEKTQRYQKDQCRVKSLTSIISGGLGYPYTALVAFGIRATDQLQGSLPNISTLVTGRVIKVPATDMFTGLYTYDADGTIAMRDAIYYDNLYNELDNPVWCLYDLLTNTRYGLGQYYPIDDSKRNIMIANFHYAASYCDERITYTDENGVERMRKRFTLNIVLDQAKSASDWVDTIKATIRANLYYSQGIFWIDIDRPKNVTQLFNMSNLREYTQSGTSYHAVPNVIEVQFPNPKIDYAMDVFRVESPEYLADASIEENKKVMTMIGVTDIEQCKSLVKYAFNKSKLTKQISFKTGTEGIRCQANDIIGISHDVPQWGAGGRIIEVEENGNSITCTTDIPIKIADVTGNKFYIQDYKGVVHTVVATSIHVYDFTFNKTTAVITSTNAVSTFIPNYDSDDNSNFHQDAFSYGVAQFKVLSIQKDSDLLSTITATEFDPSLYALVDDTSDMSTIVTQNYSQIPVPFKTSVDSVAITTSAKLDNNLLRPVVNITYSRPAATGFTSVDVHMTKVGSMVYSLILQNVKTSSIEYFSSELADGEYQFVLTANYGSRKQSLTDALRDTSVVNKANVNLTTLRAEYFKSGVSGLAVVTNGNPNTNEFYEKDCKLIWRKPIVADALAAAPVGATAGVEQANTLFSHYIVTISKNGSIRRKATVYGESYVYSHELNHQDGITRTFEVTVIAYDIYGRSSAPVTITCSNPAPAKIAKV